MLGLNIQIIIFMVLQRRKEFTETSPKPIGPDRFDSSLS
jgi:hypothetical protein